MIKVVMTRVDGVSGTRKRGLRLPRDIGWRGGVNRQAGAARPSSGDVHYKIGH
jgi:hypothetical protein